MTKEFKPEDAIITLEIGNEKYPLPLEESQETPYDKSDFLIVGKDYSSDPIWDGHSGANDWLGSYKEDIPELLYWELENYDKVWEIQSNLSLNVVMSDREEDEIKEIFSGMFSIDFTEWEKSLATRLAKAVPHIQWGYKVWKEEGGYTTVIAGE